MSTYEELWDKYSKEYKALHRRAEDIFDELHKSAAMAIQKGGEAEKKTGDDIKNFLSGTKDTRMDSCIRWLILMSAAGHQRQDEYDNSPSLTYMIKGHSLLVRILVGLEKSMAFENLYNPAKGSGISSFKAKCEFGNLHFMHQKNKSTPFYKAISEGHYEAVEIMIESFKEYLQSLNISSDAQASLLKDILQKEDQKETPLQKAASASQYRLETIKVLLKYPDIVEHNDAVFEESLASGRNDVVELYLEISSLKDRLVTSDNIVLAMTEMSKLPDLSQRNQDHELRYEDNAGQEKENSPREGQQQIVNSLLKHVESQGIDGFAIAQKVIELGLTNFWEPVSKMLKANNLPLLHTAVRHQSIAFVRRFLKENPKSVITKGSLKAVLNGIHEEGEQSEDFYYPLWYNNKKLVNKVWVDQQGDLEIRDALVSATIKQMEKMHVLSDIFHESAEKVRELCFDMSQFNSKAYRVPDFFYSLIGHSENEGLLSYERTIKYARFPPLDLNTNDRDIYGESVKHEHGEVFDVLDWLLGIKNVKSIVELKVPDRLVNPHNELDIATYVDKFEVEVLNWRFLDMSLSIFSEDSKSRIRSIRLYPSGKQAVIDHWFSDSGLKSFENLTEIYIHIVQELMTKERCVSTRELIKENLKGLKDIRPALITKAKINPWNPTLERMANLEEIAQRAFPKLSLFIKNYRKYSHPNGDVIHVPTKVAIIDNGILSISPLLFTEESRNRPIKPVDRRSPRQADDSARPSIDATSRSAHDQSRPDLRHKQSTKSTNTVPDHGDKFQDNSHHGEKHDRSYQPDRTGYKTLWARIKSGVSYVDDDSQLSPWLFASDPHGTQMANVICAIDPLCELYVAKVVDHHRGIIPERVEKAIRWAIKQQVDVICMSFATIDKHKVLRASIREAQAAGIVMLCSTHDEGAKATAESPADTLGTITIAACDDYGTVLRPLDETKYSYKLQGLNIPAGVVPFLESSDRITGSSVATAIAAGLSSLIVSCIRLANPPEFECKGEQRRDLVVEHLNKLCVPKSTYISLEKFGDISTPLSKGEEIDVQAILRDHFVVNQSP